MKIMTWNACIYDYNDKYGNREKLDITGVLNCISGESPDVFIMQSYHIAYKELIEGLKKLGFKYFDYSQKEIDKVDRNRLLIATKVSFQRAAEVPYNLGFYEKNWREISIVVDSVQYRILGVHVPTATLFNKFDNLCSKMCFLANILLKSVEYYNASESAIIAGTLNIDKNYSDRIECCEYIDKLSQGMIDVSPNLPTYAKYKYDYIFVNNSLNKQHTITTTTRDTEYSDHSYIVMEINPKGEQKMEIVNKITPGLFDDIIAYTVAEPGAMGLPSTMEFISNKGEHFLISFDDIPFAEIKKAFTSAALHECFFNGPKKYDETEGEVVLYLNDERKNNRETRVAPGWHHVYMGAGNHLVIKEEYYCLFDKCMQDKSPSEIYCTWDDYIEAFVKEVSGKE